MQVSSVSSLCIIRSLALVRIYDSLDSNQFQPAESAKKKANLPGELNKFVAKTCPQTVCYRASLRLQKISPLGCTLMNGRAMGRTRESAVIGT